MSALIARDDARLAVAFTAEAVALKESALAVAGLIGKVTNATENATAVQAQVELKGILAQAEKARRACKEPVLEYGRKIDDAARSFCDELNAEMARVSLLVGNFQQLEQAKARAAERARNEELTRLERERAAAEAQATSHDALDAIAKHFNDKEKAISSDSPQPARIAGQIVRKDYEIEVTDIWLLAKAHPVCVKIEPRLSEIKEMLRQGVKVAGVRATEITTATVRANTRTPAAIEA